MNQLITNFISYKLPGITCECSIEDKASKRPFDLKDLENASPELFADLLKNRKCVHCDGQGEVFEKGTWLCKTHIVCCIKDASGTVCKEMPIYFHPVCKQLLCRNHVKRYACLLTFSVTAELSIGR